MQKAQQFQTDVLGVLRGMEYIKKRKTAILLLAAINDGCPGKTLTIVPHRKQDGDARTFFSSENRATAKGEDYFDPRYGQIVKGQGAGTNAVIEYDPWQYMNANCFRELSPFRNDRIWTLWTRYQDSVKATCASSPQTNSPAAVIARACKGHVPLIAEANAQPVRIAIPADGNAR